MANPRDLLTKAGFFSLLVFRGITFHSEFLMRPDSATGQVEKVFFKDLDHWNAVKNAHQGQPEKFFCKKNAYGGSCTTQRKTGNAENFWIAADLWTAFVQGKTIPLSFALTKTLLDRKDMDTAMRSIGSLIKMLILGTCASLIQK